MQVFISYAKEDYEFALKIYKDLKNAGYEPWIDREDILGGRNRKSEIKQTIKSTKYFLALLSTNSVSTKGFFQKELKLAFDVLDEFPPNTPFIIPLCIDDYPIKTERLSSIQQIDFNFYEQGFQKLRQAMSEPEIDDSDLNSDNWQIHQLDLDTLVQWCLRKIIEDQYTEGTAKGAWGKRNPEYMEIFYGKSRPGDMSYGDSITMSSEVAIALNRFRSAYSNHPLSKNVILVLNLLQDYLERHFDYETGGCGPRLPKKRRGESKIDISPRHTAWAMLALWELGNLDSKTEEILRKAGGFLANVFNALEDDEWSMTYAVFHKLLTTAKLSNVVMMAEVKKRSIIKFIENMIIKKYDRKYGAWDIDHPTDPDYPKKARITSSFQIVNVMNIDKCIDLECVKLLENEIHSLCEKRLIKVDEQKVGLQFHDESDADIGYSILLLHVLLKNKNRLKLSNDFIQNIFNYVLDPAMREGNLQFAFPWDLAYILRLVSDPSYKLNYKPQSESI